MSIQNMDTWSSCDHLWQAGGSPVPLQQPRRLHGLYVVHYVFMSVHYVFMSVALLLLWTSTRDFLGKYSQMSLYCREGMTQSCCAGMQEVERLLKEVQKMQDERDQARQQVRMDRRQAEQASLSGEAVGTTPHSHLLVTVHWANCSLHAGQRYRCADFGNMQKVCSYFVGLDPWYVQSAQCNIFLFPAP